MPREYYDQFGNLNWGYPIDVGHLILQLQTLDPKMKVSSVMHIDTPGGSKARAYGLSMSRERWDDGGWLDFKLPVPECLAIWATASSPETKIIGEFEQRPQRSQSMANSYSDRQIFGWIEATRAMLEYESIDGEPPMLRGWCVSTPAKDRPVGHYGQVHYGATPIEAISAAMEASGIEPEPVETVSMAELMMVFARVHLGNCRTRLGRRLDRERAIRAVLALAEGKTVKDN